MSVINLQNIRQSEGLMDSLQEIRSKLEQRVNLDNHSGTQKPVSLSGNKIKHIPSTICFLSNLAVLDLRGNPIDPYEIKVAQALLPSCRILF